MMEVPEYLTHYYREQPFRTLTTLNPQALAKTLTELAGRRELPRRLTPEFSEFYFEQRHRFEAVMYDQFVDKGGRPQRRQPHYAVLGESDIWAEHEPHSIRIPLAAIPPDAVSFTYGDSWHVYVDRDLQGNRLPRKPQYEMLYRLDELPALIEQYGWPENQSEEDDVYLEAQIWCDRSVWIHSFTKNLPNPVADDASVRIPSEYNSDAGNVGHESWF